MSIFDDLARQTSNNLTADATKPPQDYIVLPNQRCLDGIAVSPGIVKQLVAVPTVSQCRTARNAKLKTQQRNLWTQQSTGDGEATGASLEWQISGKDTIGGIQLQILPELEIDRMWAGNTEDIIGSHGFAITDKESSTGQDEEIVLQSYKDPIPASVSAFDLLKTPRELGLREGQNIHIKDLKNLQKNRPKTVGELATEAQLHGAIDGTIDLEVEYSCQYTFNIQPLGSQNRSLSLKV